MVNDSKKKDPRFICEWIKAGAVAIMDHPSLREALYWLNNVRRRPADAADYKFDWIRNGVLEAGVTLEYIGTNEEDLAMLLKNMYIAQAKYWLDNVRKNPDNVADYKFDWIRNDVRKAGVTLEYIGTDEAEMGRLRRRAA